MLRMTLLIWAFYMILFMAKGIEGFVGVNWGRKASQALAASTVVDLVMQNGLNDARIVGAGAVVAQAFANSNVSLSLTILNDQLNEKNTTMEANKWVQTKVSRFIRKNITLRYIIVGENPFSTANVNKTHHKAVDVLDWLSQALQAAKHNNIKATIPHFTDVFKPVTKPSDADFVDEIKDLMIRTVRVLQQYNAPFMLDIYPIYTVKMMNWDPEFAFIDNKSNFTIKDNGTVYRNVFEFWYDACIWALRKAGAPDLKIVVGQIGWPTDGYPGANTGNATRFYKSFLRHIIQGKGTPLRPGPIDVYLQSLVDENQVAITHGPFQRHWGIYKFDGISKLNIDFTGQGREITLPNAAGVTRMPSRWCVYDGKNDDPALVKKWFDEACAKSDCSSLGYGGTCNFLNATGNVSYAFNMNFQIKGQKAYDCVYNGASIVVHDPSIDDCKFPVAILSSDLVDRGQSYRRKEREEGASIKLSTPSVFLTLLIMIFCYISLG